MDAKTAKDDYTKAKEAVTVSTRVALVAGQRTMKSPPYNCVANVRKRMSYDLRMLECTLDTARARAIPRAHVHVGVGSRSVKN